MKNQLKNGNPMEKNHLSDQKKKKKKKILLEIGIRDGKSLAYDREKWEQGLFVAITDRRKRRLEQFTFTFAVLSKQIFDHNIFWHPLRPPAAYVRHCYCRYLHK